MGQIPKKISIAIYINLFALRCAFLTTIMTFKLFFPFRIFVPNIYLCPPAFTRFRVFLSGMLKHLKTSVVKAFAKTHVFFLNHSPSLHKSIASCYLF